eukprot:NODE_86_length_22075_cov_1.190253.p3 type:complete len:579 gc:universal NODE_86_length_22075_cov_1.190253:17521-19257(+)
MILCFIFVLLAKKSPPYVRPKDSLVIELNPKNFNSHVKPGNNLLVAYYAHWCHYSKKMLPKLDELSHKVKNLPISIVTYDCELKGQAKICDDLKIDGYPTLFSYKGIKKVKEYEQGENVDLLMQFVNEFLKSENAPKVLSKEGYNFVRNYYKPPKAIANPKGEVILLTDSNFEGLVQKDPWFVEFYAEWCGHCKALAPTWTKLGGLMREKLNIGKIDASVNKRIGSKYSVQGYPTLLFIHGDKVEKYRGDRSLESLKQFSFEMKAKSFINEFTEKDIAQVKDMPAIGFLIYSNNINEKLKTNLEISEDLKFISPFYSLSFYSAKAIFPKIAPTVGPPTYSKLKDHDHYVMLYYPKSLEVNRIQFYFSNSVSRVDLKNWYNANRFPFLVDLTSSNSEALLSEPKYLILGLGEKRNDLEEMATKIKDLVPPHAYPAEISRAVQFVSVDVNKYGDWADRLFGLKQGIIILSNEKKVYYKADPDGSLITLGTILPSLKSLIDIDIFQQKLKSVAQPSSWEKLEWTPHEFAPSGFLQVILTYLEIYTIYRKQFYINNSCDGIRINLYRLCRYVGQQSAGLSTN